MVDAAVNTEYITETWKMDVKQVLDDAMALRQEISWWSAEFSKGDIFNVPTMGQLTVRDYTEGGRIKTENTTSANFTLTIDKYKQVGIQVTDKFKEDSVYVDNLIGKYKVEVISALMRQLESDIANLQAAQTASDPNLLSGSDHRFVSIATSEAGGVEDFQLALLTLSEANAMTSHASAYINPLFLYRLQQISNLISQDVYGTNVLLKEGGLMGKMITAALETRIHVGKIAGFETFNHTVLDNSLSETITGTASTPFAGARTVTSAIANMFLGKEAFAGAMRTKPMVEEFRDHAHKSDVIHSSFRYGLKTYRPESVVVCLTDAA